MTALWYMYGLYDSPPKRYSAPLTVTIDCRYLSVPPAQRSECIGCACRAKAAASAARDAVRRSTIDRFRRRRLGVTAGGNS